VVFGDKTGVLDVPAVLKALKGVKFKGYIAIEYEANETDPTADVKACLAYFKEAVKKAG
jgi:sugar phosphate isomerase/epimerase